MSIACILLTGSQSFTAAAANDASNEDRSGSRAAAPSSSSTPSAASAEELSFDQYSALVNDLEKSDVPRTTKVVDGRTVYTFSMDGSELTLTDFKTEDGFETYLGGGWDGGGPYVTFNQVDQGALIAGGGAGLAAAICAIPAVGTAACVAATAIVAAATYYVLEYGRCPNGEDLKVYVFPQDNRASCVPAN